jgi:MscS family membrane protein
VETDASRHLRQRKGLRRGLVVALLVGLLAGPAVAQAPEAAPTEPEPPATAPIEDFSKPMGPADPFNRGTPRGSVYGFISACRAGDYERAANFLDLRRLPRDEQARGPELARKLKAVLDQKLWVDYTHLSDTNAGQDDDGLPAWQDRVGMIESADGPVAILLQRIAREGDEVRIWVFASVTVAAIPALYQEFGPLWLERHLPRVFFEVHFLGPALWQWLGLAAAAAAGWLLAMLISGTTIRVLGFVLMRGGGTLDERIVRVVSGPVRLAVTVMLFSLGRRFLGLDLQVHAVLSLLERLLLVTAAAWLFFRMLDVAVLALRVRAERRGNLGVIPVLVPVQRFAKVLVVVIGVLGVLGTLGVNISAAVAGLGVGGIAVALAAQKTIENLFGGATLFADRPVRVGDFCRYQGEVGTVEEIGLRSTRIRTLDRTIVTVPNSEFSNLMLENFAVRDRMRLFTMVGVRYETTPDQLRFLLARLREILVAHPRVTEDPARVRFVGFGACSLDLEVFAYVNTADWSEFLAIREDLYLQFMDAVNEAGTGFAFPSTTTYVGRDDGLDEAASREAEARVARWRESGELPFPSLPEERRREIENTLRWPPPGSPNARED